MHPLIPCYVIPRLFIDSTTSRHLTSTQILRRLGMIKRKAFAVVPNVQWLGTYYDMFNKHNVLVHVSRWLSNLVPPPLIPSSLNGLKHLLLWMDDGAFTTSVLHFEWIPCTCVICFMWLQLGTFMSLIGTKRSYNCPSRNVTKTNLKFLHLCEISSTS